MLLVLSLLAVGCGPKEPCIELEFALDIQRAIDEGRILPDADRERVCADTLGVIRKRLERYDTEFDMWVRGTERFGIEVPVSMSSSVDSIVQTVTSLGDLKFRIEVFPREMYRHWKEDGSMAPRLEQRSSLPWQGTPEEFLAFKEREVEAFKQARDNAMAYKPSDPRYFVVPRHGTEADEVLDFAVLEEPRDRMRRFDGHILENPAVGRDPYSGKPVVLYEVKVDYQNVFSRWTGENVGLPMAIVLNETYRSAPVINSPLSEAVQITLGAGMMSELEREAEELVTVLQTGVLKVRPRLIAVDAPVVKGGGD